MLFIKNIDKVECNILYGKKEKRLILLFFTFICVIILPRNRQLAM